MDVPIRTANSVVMSTN